MLGSRGGKELASVMLPPVLKMMELGPAVALELMIAWRKDPAPLSLVFVTVKVAPKAGAVAENSEKKKSVSRYFLEWRLE